MADVASVAQGAQFGVEAVATPGTPVAAILALNDLSITTGVEGVSETFRPDGHKYAALAIPGKEWAGFDYTGKLTYSGIVYVLDSLIRHTSPTSNKWTVAPQNAAEDAHTTYTIEKGGAVRAHKFAYGMFDSLVIDVSRDACDISGTGFGQLITDGVTLTSTPTAVTLDPVLPRLFDVALDTTAAGLGGTKLLRTFTGRVNLGGLVGPIWPINSSNASFASHVELVPNSSVTMWVEHDLAGTEFLTILRSGATRFLRLKAVGDTIVAGTPPTTALFQLDLAVKSKQIAKHSDREGVYGWEVTLDLVNDDAWGKPYEFQVQNLVTGIASA